MNRQTLAHRIERISPFGFLIAIVLVALLVPVDAPQPAFGPSPTPVSTIGDLPAAIFGPELGDVANVVLVDERYEDDSAVLGVTWTNPSCPDPIDEPCYFFVIIPAGDSPGDRIEFHSGP